MRFNRVRLALIFKGLSTTKKRKTSHFQRLQRGKIRYDMDRTCNVQFDAKLAAGDSMSAQDIKCQFATAVHEARMVSFRSLIPFYIFVIVLACLCSQMNQKFLSEKEEHAYTRPAPVGPATATPLEASPRQPQTPSSSRRRSDTKDTKRLSPDKVAPVEVVDEDTHVVLSGQSSSSETVYVGGDDRRRDHSDGDEEDDDDDDDELLREVSISSKCDAEDVAAYPVGGVVWIQYKNYPFWPAKVLVPCVTLTVDCVSGDAPRCAHDHRVLRR